MNTTFREKLKNKKRIVIKIGSSSLTHPDTGYLDLIKLEVLVQGNQRSKESGKRRNPGFFRCHHGRK